LSVTPAFIDKMSDLLADQLIKDDKDDRWWTWSKAMEPRERDFRKVLSTLFAAQKADVLKRVARHPPTEQGKAIKAAGDEWLFNAKEWEDNFTKSCKPLIVGSIEQGGNELLAEIGLAVNFNVTDPRVVEHIATHIPLFSFEVNKTTLDQLRREFTQAIDAGEGIRDVTKRVEKIFGFPEKFRNQRIAQTEILGASNYGNYEGMVQSGIVATREWLSSRDARVRDSHRLLDGQVRELDKRYSNGLMHPHGSGPAAEVVNCRCTEIVSSFKGAGI